MPAKIGTVNRVRRLFGFGDDWEVQINGESFYRRLGLPGEKTPNCCVGMRVRLEYEEKRTGFGDWVADRVFGFGYSVPQRYREISKIECSP